MTRALFPNFEAGLVVIGELLGLVLGDGLTFEDPLGVTFEPLGVTFEELGDVELPGVTLDELGDVELLGVTFDELGEVDGTYSPT